MRGMEVRVRGSLDLIGGRWRAAAARASVGVDREDEMYVSILFCVVVGFACLCVCVSMAYGESQKEINSKELNQHTDASQRQSTPGTHTRTKQAHKGRRGEKRKREMYARD